MVQVLLGTGIATQCSLHIAALDTVWLTDVARLLNMITSALHLRWWPRPLPRPRPWPPCGDGLLAALPGAMLLPPLLPPSPPPLDRDADDPKLTNGADAAVWLAAAPPAAAFGDADGLAPEWWCPAPEAREARAPVPPPEPNVSGPEAEGACGFSGEGEVAVELAPLAPAVPNAGAAGLAEAPRCCRLAAGGVTSAGSEVLPQGLVLNDPAAATAAMAGAALLMGGGKLIAGLPRAAPAGGVTMNEALPVHGGLANRRPGGGDTVLPGLSADLGFLAADARGVDTADEAAALLLAAESAAAGAAAAAAGSLEPAAVESAGVAAAAAVGIAAAETAVGADAGAATTDAKVADAGGCGAEAAALVKALPKPKVGAGSGKGPAGMPNGSFFGTLPPAAGWEPLLAAASELAEVAGPAAIAPLAGAAVATAGAAAGAACGSEEAPAAAAARLPNVTVGPADCAARRPNGCVAAATPAACWLKVAWKAAVWPKTGALAGGGKDSRCVSVGTPPKTNCPSCGDAPKE